MLKLDLNSPPAVRLPASAFPDFADEYVCDKCGRDITKHLRRSRAHATAIGRETFLCSCGEKYRTNAVEWDSFSGREKRQQIAVLTVAALLFSVFSSILAIPIYFVLRVFVPMLAIVVGTAVATGPFIAFQIFFWLPILASVWRTRIARARRAS